MAEKNGLKIGDKIQTDKGVEIEIVGLFSPKEIEGINDQVTTYDKIQNLIITDLATLVAYENGPAIQGFNELTVSVDDPQNMEEIISKVKGISGVDWKGFSFLLDNEDYENAASSLEQLSELVATILIVALIVSIAILSLILTMWARTRIHETGVLLSVGISKLSILGQYIAEVLLIAVLAFSLSYFSASAIAGQMGNVPAIRAGGNRGAAGERLICRKPWRSRNRRRRSENRTPLNYRFAYSLRKWGSYSCLGSEL